MASKSLNETFKELKIDCKVDKHKLDEECCKQTFLYAKWAKRLAIAQDNLRRVELELTQYKAKRMIEGKQDKKTDKMSESGYRMSSNYTTINMKISKLQKIADLMQTAVHSMLHRRAMIESLVKLKASNYYNET